MASVLCDEAYRSKLMIQLLLENQYQLEGPTTITKYNFLIVQV